MTLYGELPNTSAPFMDRPDAMETEPANSRWPIMDCERCGRLVRWAVLWAWVAPTDDDDAERYVWLDPDPEPGGGYRVWTYFPSGDKAMAWPLVVPAITGGEAFRRHSCPVGAKVPEDELVAT